MPDVEPHLYATAIREMIRHENDVTNHRMMRLLIGQGLIANTYVGAASAREDFVSILAPTGIPITWATPPSGGSCRSRTSPCSPQRNLPR